MDVECWCTKVQIAPEVLARVPPEWVDKACLCPACAAGVEKVDAPAAGQPR